MHDDEMMEGVLRAAMSAPQPEASTAFTQDVMRRIAPPRWTPTGRIVVGAYTLVSMALCTWAMRDFPIAIAAVALGVQIVAAVAVRGYANSLVRE